MGRLAVIRSALGGLGEAFGGPPDGLEVTVVEIADLGAVVEQHAVPLPVESVREQHLALGADGHPVDLGVGTDPITDAEVDLTVVGLGEGVRLPDRHDDSLPDRPESDHHRPGDRGRPRPERDRLDHRRVTHRHHR